MVRPNLGKHPLVCMLLQAFLLLLAHSHCRRQIEYGYGLRFVSYTEIGSKDPSPSLCNVNLFCKVQYSHRVSNLNPSI